MTLAYNVGTVAVTSGSQIVTGTATGWTNQVRPGDLFMLDGTRLGEVLTVDSNTQMTLRRPWGGNTLTEQTYAISRFSPLWSDVSAVSIRLSQFLDQLRLVPQPTSTDALKTLRVNALGTSFDLVAAPSGVTRELLTANRTYYVRTNGNDANDGLANTAVGAFATIQRAIDTVATLDLGVWNATISVADGAYGVVSLRDPTGAGSCFLTGNILAPGGVAISGGSFCVVCNGSTKWSIGGFTLSGAGGVNVNSGGRLAINGRMRFGLCSGQHVYASRDSIVSIAAGYEIFGGCVVHWQAEQKSFIAGNYLAITLTGTPAWGYAFAYCGDVSSMYVGVNTFSGAATGTRYVAGANGVINTLNGGATYLPGSVAGAVSSGGQYL